MEKDSKIFIAGHTGLVGSALVRKFKSEGYSNLITRRHSELDLTRQSEVEAFFESEQPEFVILAAAKVGGIWSNNTYPAEFIYSNIAIQTNVIHASWRAGVKRLLFLGSSCIYPRDCPQPMKEEHLLSGPLEPTNEPYAIAKIAGIKMCQSYNRQYGTKFLSIMPTNLYGPNDNFDLETSHVLPAFIRKFHEAKIQEKDKVEIWGSGKPYREFMYVDDLADACMHMLNIGNKEYDAIIKSSPPIINIGFGKDISIQSLAELIKEIVEFSGNIVNDLTKPDGTPRKLLDIAKASKLGYKPSTSLEQGIRMTYDWCLSESIF
jgi:GDP-L-fucose synthase